MPAAQRDAPGSEVFASAGLTGREHVNLAVLAIERARRAAIARLHRSRLLRWRHRAPAAADLHLAPPELRAVDAGFADELANDGLGLAGSVVDLNGRSPFAVAAPSRAWARELHGFSWLRHLEAARSRHMEATARRLVGEWMRCSARSSLAIAWEPELVGRRILSWLSHAGLLLDGAKPRYHVAVMRSLGAQITYLTASWRNAPAGYPRLVALVALVAADLCIAADQRRLARSERLLVAELERQILPDGGHLSRNPWVLVELLLDLLPLRQCLAAQGRTPPPALRAAIARMMAMLGRLRLGDGMLARFNGAGTAERDTLATVLTYADGRPPEPVSHQPSGYVRLELGATVVVADVGAPPPLELAATACAGCLSFELSTAGALLLVNAGSPGIARSKDRAVARATASHNTLCLAEQSSSRLIRNPRLERELGGAPLREPLCVTAELRHEESGIALDASHDGYAQRFGLLHHRSLRLSRNGTRLDGVDALIGARAPQRFPWDVPFAIHFHLHPDAEAHAGRSLHTAELLAGNSDLWLLTVAGAAVALEQGIFFADPGTPRNAQQVVLRGVCAGTCKVSWTLERVEGGRALAREAAAASRPLRERLSRLRSSFDGSADAGDV